MEPAYRVVLLGRPNVGKSSLMNILTKEERALKNSDIVLLMTDASEARLVDQELKLAFYAFEERNRALILLINNIDLMAEVMEYELERSLPEYKHLIDKISMLKISCKTGKNVGKVLSLIKEIWQRYNTRFSDEEIKELFLEAGRGKPLVHKRQKLEVYSTKQVGVPPPRIVLKVNQPTWFGPSQMHFFENLLRKKYNFGGVPIKFVAIKK